MYKPASLPPRNVDVPQSALMDSLLQRDVDFFDQRVDQIALGSSVSLDTPEGLYDAGAAYLRVNHRRRLLRCLIGFSKCAPITLMRSMHAVLFWLIKVSMTMR